MTISRLTLWVLSLAATVVSTSIASARDPSGVVVHEWGTFTSVAGADGRAVEWWTLSGPQDLPCFVERFQVSKAGNRGTVRMETPVLYFYTPRPTAVDVEVQFNQGTMTEWFPRAALTPAAMTKAFDLPGFKHRLVWRDVSILPGASEDFPTENGSSHYYAARATDAAPVRAAGQLEKFLFYRGVGRIAVPITARIDAGGTVHVDTRGTTLATLILFENRNGKVGYTVRHAAHGETAWKRPALTADLAALTRELERTLTAQGLYPKEARAMIETWRETWFEPGTRLFYLVPSKLIDDVLPLTITPRPVQLARVFVGRVEILTPETLRDLADAIKQENPAAAAKHGRFLPSLVERLLPPVSTDPRAHQQAMRTLSPAYAALSAGARSCRATP